MQMEPYFKRLSDGEFKHTNHLLPKKMNNYFNEEEAHVCKENNGVTGSDVLWLI